jgi:hypothetical protein
MGYNFIFINWKIKIRKIKRSWYTVIWSKISTLY